jgi:hypothetical protein
MLSTHALFYLPDFRQTTSASLSRDGNVLRSASSTSRNVGDTTLDLHPQPGCETEYPPSKPQYNDSNSISVFAARLARARTRWMLSLKVTALDFECSQLRGRAVQPPGCQIRLVEQTFPDRCSHYATEQLVWTGPGFVRVLGCLHFSVAQVPLQGTAFGTVL